MTMPALDTLTLARGAHTDRADGVCLLEAVAWFAGKDHTDRPPCVSPVLGAFGRALNDWLPDDPRQALVPFIPRMPGTAGDGLDAARLDMMTRWMARDWAARWLDLADLPEHAARMRELAIPRWPAATATATAADAADVATAVADAATAVADAADDADAAWQLREFVYQCRYIGWRCARVIALRAVTGISEYAPARQAATQALAPAVKKFRSAGVRLLDAMISPEVPDA